MTTTLQKWGNSQGIRLPKPIIDQLHFRPGTELELTVSTDTGTLVISQAKPARKVRGRHRIEDLVAAMPKRIIDPHLAKNNMGLARFA